MNRSRRFLLAFAVALAFHALIAMWNVPRVFRYLHHAVLKVPSAQEGLDVVIIPEVVGGEPPELSMPAESAVAEEEDIYEEPLQAPNETVMAVRFEDHRQEPLVMLPPVKMNLESFVSSEGVTRGGMETTGEGSPLPAGGTAVVAESFREGDVPRYDVETIWLDASDVKPRYPLGSRVRGEEGTVLIKLRVGEDGLPVGPYVLESSGFRSLDRAALDAVRRARFKVVGSDVVGIEAVLTIRFRLVD